MVLWFKKKNGWRYKDKICLYLLDRSFDQKPRQKVSEVPALLGFSAGLSHGRRAERKPDHTSVILHFLDLRSHILTHFQLWTHESKEIITWEILTLHSQSIAFVLCLIRTGKRARWRSFSKTVFLQGMNSDQSCFVKPAGLFCLSFTAFLGRKALVPLMPISMM